MMSYGPVRSESVRDEAVIQLRESESSARLLHRQIKTAREIISTAIGRPVSLRIELLKLQ